MNLQRKVEITKLGRVKVSIRQVKKQNGKTLKTKIFTGTGLSVPEATQKALNKMFNFTK